MYRGRSKLKKALFKRAQLVDKIFLGCALVLVVAPGRIAGRAFRPRLRSSAGTGHIHTSCVQVASADILSAARGLARRRSLQVAPPFKPGHIRSWAHSPGPFQEGTAFATRATSTVMSSSFCFSPPAPVWASLSSSSASSWGRKSLISWSTPRIQSSLSPEPR